MQTFARIQDGVVAELVEIPDALLEERFHPDLVAAMVEVPDGVQPAYGWTWSEGEGFAPPAGPSIAALAAAKRAQIHAQARARRDALIPTYPDHERETWDQQAREAEAYAADPQADPQADPPPVTPLLSAIAAARGVTLAEMVAKVEAKAAAFAAAGGAVIGAQQALEDALEAVLAAYGPGGTAEGDAAAAEAALAAIDPADPANWPQP